MEKLGQVSLVSFKIIVLFFKLCCSRVMGIGGRSSLFTVNCFGLDLGKLPEAKVKSAKEAVLKLTQTDGQ